jgi:hypothetical protein
MLLSAALYQWEAHAKRHSSITATKGNANQLGGNVGVFKFFSAVL